jgi:ferredoxin-thioredoxin reductase catalytic subunit
MTTLDEVRQRAESDAQTSGYYLNPDADFLKDLLEGLLRNEERYGYLSCPCRLASGKFELDRDIICPCDYRDPDVQEFGYCYCALYVRKDVVEGERSVVPIPERRPLKKQARARGGLVEDTTGDHPQTLISTPRRVSIKNRLWYCKQCGYVCYREDPPYICPICKAKRKMLSQITVTIQGQ